MNDTARGPGAGGAAPSQTVKMGRVPETREIYKTLDLCLRIGEVLLSSGAGAADVTASMLSVSYALGLRSADVDVTFTSLSMSYQTSFDEPALIQVRSVRHRDIDYEDLTEVNFIVNDIITGDLDVDEARSADGADRLLRPPAPAVGGHARLGVRRCRRRPAHRGRRWSWC